MEEPKGGEGGEGRRGNRPGLIKGDRREEAEEKNGRRDLRVERITTWDEVTEKRSLETIEES